MSFWRASSGFVFAGVSAFLVGALAGCGSDGANAASAEPDPTSVGVDAAVDPDKSPDTPVADAAATDSADATESTDADPPSQTDAGQTDAGQTDANPSASSDAGLSDAGDGGSSASDAGHDSGNTTPDASSMEAGAGACGLCDRIWVCNGFSQMWSTAADGRCVDQVNHTALRCDGTLDGTSANDVGTWTGNAQHIALNFNSFGNIMTIDCYP